MTYYESAEGITITARHVDFCFAGVRCQLDNKSTAFNGANKMNIVLIRDSYNRGMSEAVAKIGNAYFICSTMTQNFSDADIKAIAGISDWSDGKKAKTQKTLRDRFAANLMTCETCYDAVHGRRYSLCVYPAGDANARRVVMAAKSGMTDTNPEIARSIDWEA